MIFNKIKRFESKLEKDQYIQSISGENLSNGHIMNITILIFELFMIVFSLIRGEFHLPRRVMYLCSYIFLLTCSLVFFIIIKVNKKNDFLKPKNIMTLTKFYSIAIVAWGVFVSILDSKNAYQSIVFLTVITGVTLTVTLHPIFTAILQLFSSVSFVLAVSLVYDGGFDFNQTINITIYTIIILILGIISHNKSLEEFRRQKEIKIKNEQLLVLNNQFSKANSMLLELSSTDALTKLYNRMTLNSDMQTLINKCKKNNELICCATLDVDHFKNVNDTYGHIAGDECLVKVSDVLRSASKHFRIYRYGGEEFVIIAGNMSTEKFLNNIEKIRLGVEALTFTQQDLKVTISAGVYSNHVTEESSSDEFFNNSDKALYNSKNNGRNCICYYQAN